MDAGLDQLIRKVRNAKAAKTRGEAVSFADLLLEGVALSERIAKATSGSRLSELSYKASQCVAAIENELWVLVNDPALTARLFQNIKAALLFCLRRNDTLS
jgi:hypothetical protein